MARQRWQLPAFGRIAFLAVQNGIGRVGSNVRKPQDCPHAELMLRFIELSGESDFPNSDRRIKNL
jgi:hypothetical protein